MKMKNENKITNKDRKALKFLQKLINNKEAFMFGIRNNFITREDANRNIMKTYSLEEFLSEKPINKMEEVSKLAFIESAIKQGVIKRKPK